MKMENKKKYRLLKENLSARRMARNAIAQVCFSKYNSITRSKSVRAFNNDEVALSEYLKNYAFIWRDSKERYDYWSHLSEIVKE